MCENDCVTFKLNCNQRQSISHFRDIQNQLRRERLPYFTTNEIVTHNTPNDCWVSFLGIVRDLTPLVDAYRGRREVLPILAFAGKDISDWFDERTGDIVHHVDPITGVRVPYLPHGLLPDVRPQVPTNNWHPLDHQPWWFDASFVVGYVSRNTRPVRIMNVLTGRETKIDVCAEDTLERILERYLFSNSHAQSYTWKYETRVLDMGLNLDENLIPDPRPRFRALGLSDDTYIPSLMLYFNDDLT